MKSLKFPMSRRGFLATAGASVSYVSLVALTRTAAADTPKLSLDDPTAKSLGYVHETATDGQRCNNCTLWQGADAEWGGCAIFPGKDVSANGWCKSWVKKT